MTEMTQNPSQFATNANYGTNMMPPNASMGNPYVTNNPMFPGGGNPGFGMPQ